MTKFNRNRSYRIKHLLGETDRGSNSYPIWADNQERCCSDISSEANHSSTMECVVTGHHENKGLLFQSWFGSLISQYAALESGNMVEEGRY